MEEKGKLTRREFLQVAAFAVAAVALGGCKPEVGPVPSTVIKDLWTDYHRRFTLCDNEQAHWRMPSWKVSDDGKEVLYQGDKAAFVLGLWEQILYRKQQNKPNFDWQARMLRVRREHWDQGNWGWSEVSIGDPSTPFVLSLFRGDTGYVAMDAGVVGFVGPFENGEKLVKSIVSGAGGRDDTGARAWRVTEISCYPLLDIGGSRDYPEIVERGFRENPTRIYPR